MSVTDASASESAETDQDEFGTALRLEVVMQAFWILVFVAVMGAIGLETFVLYVPLHRRSVVPVILCATLVVPLWKYWQHILRQRRVQGGWFKSGPVPLPGRNPKVRVPWLPVIIGVSAALLVSTIAGLYF
jgi:hypothetical protein